MSVWCAPIFWCANNFRNGHFFASVAPRERRRPHCNRRRCRSGAVHKDICARKTTLSKQIQADAHEHAVLTFARSVRIPKTRGCGRNIETRVFGAASSLDWARRSTAEKKKCSRVSQRGPRCGRRRGASALRGAVCRPTFADFAYDRWSIRPRLQLGVSHRKQETRPALVDTPEYTTALDRAYGVLESILQAARPSALPTRKTVPGAETKETKSAKNAKQRLPLSWQWSDPSTRHDDTTIRIESAAPRWRDERFAGFAGFRRTRRPNYCSVCSASPNRHDLPLVDRLRRDLEYAEFDYVAKLYWPNGVAFDTVLRETHSVSVRPDAQSRKVGPTTVPALCSSAAFRVAAASPRAASPLHQDETRTKRRHGGTRVQFLATLRSGDVECAPNNRRRHIVGLSEICTR